MEGKSRGRESEPSEGRERRRRRKEEKGVREGERGHPPFYWIDAYVWTSNVERADASVRRKLTCQVGLRVKTRDGFHHLTVVSALKNNACQLLRIL